MTANLYARLRRLESAAGGAALDMLFLPAGVEIGTPEAGRRSAVRKRQRGSFSEADPTDQAAVVGPDRKHLQRCEPTGFAVIVPLIISSLSFAAAPRSKERPWARSS